MKTTDTLPTKRLHVPVGSRLNEEVASMLTPKGIAVIVNRMHEPVWLMDLTLRFIYINAPVQIFTGYTLDELRELALDKLLTPESFSIFSASVAPHFNPEALAEKDREINVDCQLEVQSKDGIRTICDITLTVLRDADGNATSILGIGRDITDRIKMETQLVQFQDNFRQLLENLNEVVFVTDAAGRFTYISPVIEQVSGFTAEECLGKSFSSFIHPDDIAVILPLFRKVLAGENQIIEFRVIDKDATTHFVRTSNRPIYEDAKITGVSGTMTENTSQKRAENALAESEARYRNIIESIDDGYYESDLSGKITFINEGISKIYGCPMEDILGKSFHVFTDENSARMVMGVCREIYAGNLTSSVLDWNITRKDGGTVSIENSISLLRDQNEKPTGFHGIVRDVTQRRKALQDFRKLSRALEQSPISVVITDVHGDIEYTNPMFTTLTGYTFEEVKGRNPRILKSGETSTEEYEELWNTLSQGREWRGEFHNRKKDGALFWERAALSPIFDDSGTITHYLAVKEDITEQKQMAEAQRQSEARYRMLADNIQDVVWVAQDMRFTYVSPSVKGQWGYEPQELLGKHLHEVMVSHSFFALKDELPDITANENTGGYRSPFEIEMVCKSGTHLWTEASISRVELPDTEHAAIQGVSRNIALRKVIEDALQENLSLMQVLIDSIPHPIFYTDLQGRVVGCNKSFESITGALKGDMFGRNLAEVLPEGSSLRNIADSLQEKRDWPRCEINNLPYADGGIHDIVFSSTTFTNINGEPLGLVCVIFDITDQKKQAVDLQTALNESRKSQLEITALLDTAHAVLESHSFKQAIESIYKTCKSLTKAQQGYVSIFQEDTGQYETVHQDSVYTADAIWAGDGLSSPEVWNLLNGDGRLLALNTVEQGQEGAGNGLLPENVLYAPVLVEGKPQGRIVLLNKPDGFIADDLRLLQALREFAALSLLNNRTMRALETSEKRFRSVAQSANDSVITFDGDGRVIFWNNMAERMFGYAEAEILNQDISTIFSSRAKGWYPQDLVRMIHALSKQISKDEHSVGRIAEMQGLRKDAHEFPIEISVSIWEIDKRRFFTAIIRDITDRKKLEESLRRETDDLKQARRELELAYQELKQTQAQILQREKMASIGQLAAGVAHEINNPMGFIGSNLGTLEKYTTRLAEFITAQSDYIQSIGVPAALNETRRSLKVDYIIEDIQDLIKESLEGAERVKRIVQDLKSFSRVDQAEFKHADINECLESTINIVWNELKYKATVRREYGEIPLTKCYPQQLNQVFMNLLINAAHAIEKQGEIIVKTWREDAWINISITDTGSGMEPELLNRIFEPFYTTKPVGSGTGLGLSITYDIIKKHSGEIRVQSEPGSGTTFTLCIPLVEEK